MGLRIEPAYDNTQAVETLFSEYTDMLIEGDGTFREYLSKRNRIFPYAIRYPALSGKRYTYV